MRSSPSIWAFSGWIWVVLVPFYPSVSVSAQESIRPVVIPRITSSIQLDGRIDEPAWDALEPIPLVMFEPSPGAEPTEPTEIRIGYDDKYLYVSGRFFTSLPEDVTASSLYRDRVGADDVFRILLDTYDDNENAVVFATNPAGVRVDEAVAADGGRVDRDFNAHWDAATHRDDRGWFAEIRIPFSSLRFQPRGDSVSMGLLISRFSAAHNETSTYPSVRPEYANATYRPSLAAPIVLRGVRANSVMWVVPYVLTGAERRTPTSTPMPATFDGELELGGDVKVPVTSNVNVDLTVNTDFAQVEVDREQVNLSRFSLFFPEKRQFFLERSGVFDLSTGIERPDPSRFFHTRRIGLTPDGQPLRIYGGARAVGRLGEWDLGALSLHVEGIDSPENLGVLRVRRRLLNERSTAGFFLTTRLGQQQTQNIAYALDARVNPFDQDYLDIQLSQSFDGTIRPTSLDQTMFRVSLARRSDFTTRGLGYTVGFKRAGREYRPGLGFTPRRDYMLYAAAVRYGLFLTKSPIRSLQLSLMSSLYTRNADGAIDTFSSAAFLNYGLRSGASGWLGIQREEEALTGPLSLAKGVLVPAGRYRYVTVNVGFTPPTGRPLRIGFRGRIGQLYDGRRITATVIPEWDVSRHLQLAAEYQFERVEFETRSAAFRTDVAGVRIHASLDAHLSGSAFVQSNRLDDRVAINLRVRYHFSEGRDLWVVFNEELRSFDGSGAPGLPSRWSSLLVKYSHPLGVPDVF